MKAFALIGTLFLALAAGAQPGIATPSGQVVCGGHIDQEKFTFSHVPLTEILVAEDAQERFLIYVDLSKKGQAKFVFVWGPSGAEAREIATSQGTQGLETLLKWSGDLKTMMWMGFSDGMIHMELERAKHMLRVSCQILK